MNFSRIAFTNFAVFRGRQVLDLPPRSTSRPIILIGGLNGSGKTSIIEGIVLGLYGFEGWRWWFRSGSGRRRDYHARIAAALNHRARHDGERQITLELELALDDASATLSIRREWWVEPEGIDEDLQLRRDGMPVSPECLPEERLDILQAYINELLPPEVSPFFFFDGERVRDYARHASPDRLRDGIDRLLKLDVVNSLLKHLGQLNARHDLVELDPLLRRQEELELAIKAREAELASLRTEIDDLHRARDRKDAERRHLMASSQAQFGGVEAELDGIDEQMTALGREAKDLGHQLGHSLGGVVPLALCMPLVNRLDSAARQSASNRRATERAADALVHIDRIITIAEDTGLVDESHTFWQHINAYREQTEVGLSLSVDAHVIEGMTQREITDLHRRATEAAHLDHKEIRVMARRLDDLTHEHRRLFVQMNQIRKGAQQTDYVNRVDTLAHEAGQIEGSIKAMESQIDAQEAEYERHKQDLRDTRTEISRIRTQNRRGALFARTTETIEAVRRGFRRDQLYRLAEHLRFTSAQLARKQALFSRIELDLELTTLRLLDTTGYEVEMSKLSSGEAQIVALALLWALSRSVSHTMPCVLDTPLGRLDSTHRERMADTYFKQAGAQVIILSTDEEIAGPYLETLSDHVAADFRLVHDEQSETSRFTPGYFDAEAAS